VEQGKVDTDTDIDLECSDPPLDGDETDGELDDDGVVYQITAFGADFDVDGLVKRFDRGLIYRPEFQRNFVWTWPQASKFIESILLGLPIPSVFLFREKETQKLLIVDGLQRLMTLHAFKKGYLPHNRIFKLKGVKQRFEGKVLRDLEKEDQIRFEDAIIHAVIMQQAAPDNNNNSVYHIFERLNSSGTPLHPQEMRAAIYHGKFQEKIGDINQNRAWREVFGYEHNRAKDQELILRFLALKFGRRNYDPPMKGFLNDFMSINRNKNEGELNNFKSIFVNAIERCHEALGKQAFRITRSMNVAFFDALMVAVAENPDASPHAIKRASEELSADDDFIRWISESTSNKNSVLGRITKAKEVLYASALCDK